MDEEVLAWRCDECERLTLAETTRLTVRAVKQAPTMGGAQEFVEDRAIRLCAWCLRRATELGEGRLVVDTYGNEIR